MPKALGFIMGYAALTSAMAAPPMGPDAWSLMWSDEFDGATLDSAKWKWGSLPWGGTVHNSSYASAITAADSYLEGGVLKLRCRKVTTDGKPWTEGFVHTQSKLDYTYGYAEIRAKYPNSKGTWPAFWMLSWSAGWPPEVDVAEYFGSENRMHYGLCTGTSGEPVWDSTNAYDDAAGWHTYGIEWGPGYLKWYRDDTLKKTVTGTVVPSPDMYLILNSGMNHSYDGTTPNPNYYQVDYVRVYKRSELSLNGGFENGNAPWSRRNGAGVMAGEGVDGSAAMRVLTTSGGDGAAEQTVYGLLPDTDYTVTAKARSNGWATLNIGAKNYGGTDTRSGRASSLWGTVTTPFTTGPSNTTARVYAWLPSAWATAYVDDFRVTRAAAPMNASFETGEETSFWETSGDVFVHNWTTYLRSGQHAMRFNNPNADRSAAQTIAGLKPSTVYRWSCWMRTHNQLLRIGVRDHGGSESYSGKTGMNWNWTRLQHEFSTGPSNTTATVFATIPAANRTSVVDVDDFFLAQPLPTGWTLSDIGEAQLPADAGVRNDRMVVMAGGDSLTGTADRLSFAHQSLTGDGTVTMRLRTIGESGTAAKFGIMLRESTAAGARHIFLGWRANGKIELAHRSSANGSTVASLTDSTAPSWLRIQRHGNVFTFSISSDGGTWSEYGNSIAIGLPPTILAGLAAVSGGPNNLTEVTASNVSVVSDDSDSDGIVDAWETRWFGNLGQDANGDFDHDGTPNLVENRLDLDPTSGTSRFAATMAGNNLIWPSAPGMTFEVRSSTDLYDWSTLEAIVPAAPAPAKSTSWLPPPPAGPIKFLRVQFVP